MSATHAGTKKWNKIIREHQYKQHNVPTKTTASSNPDLMKVFCVWCVYIIYIFHDKYARKPEFCSPDLIIPFGF